MGRINQLKFEQEFMDSMNEMQLLVHTNAIAKGFYQETPTVGERIALIHSEASELLETYRKNTFREASEHEGLTLSQEAEEMADIVIRVMDFAKYRCIDLGRAIVEKHRYNTGRPYMHGGKTF